MLKLPELIQQYDNRFLFSLIKQFLEELLAGKHELGATGICFYIRKRLKELDSDKARKLIEIYGLTLNTPLYESILDIQYELYRINIRLIPLHLRPRYEDIPFVLADDGDFNTDRQQYCLNYIKEIDHYLETYNDHSSN